MTANVGKLMTDVELVAGFQPNPELFSDVHALYFRDIYVCIRTG